MGFFETHKQNKEEKQRNITRLNNSIRECANQNRILQIKHLEDYLDFTSIANCETFIMAKVFCERYNIGDDTLQTIKVYLIDSNNNRYLLESDIRLPISLNEALRVLFKIIPFFIYSENENLNNKYWLSHMQCWNYGSNYDTKPNYSGKRYLFADEENYDSSIKAENDVFIRRYEISQLPDKALIYLSKIISVWEDDNLAEVVGSYDLWKEKRDFILNYKYPVNEEIKERNLATMSNNANELKVSYGEKGEENVEYALKWLPQEYLTVEKGNYGIFLKDKRVSDEKQEIDHIVVGSNGVFIIETKYLKGNVYIDDFGNWTREIDEKYEGIKSPVQQVDRHHMIVSSILKNLVEETDIHDIICLAHDSCSVTGIENSPVTITKVDMLCRGVIGTTSTKKYTESEIRKIVEEINKFRVK